MTLLALGCCASRSCTSSVSVISPNGNRTPTWVSVAGKKFIDGEPMNPATNRLAGLLYSSSGVPICWATPASSTTTRSPSVIASVWSCVT